MEEEKSSSINSKEREEVSVFERLFLLHALHNFDYNLEMGNN